MIQRLQSLYLLLGGLAFIAVVPFRTAILQEAMPWVMPTALGLSGLVAVLAIVVIFLYADRKRQLKLVGLLQYVAILAILAIFAGLYFSGGIMEASTNIGVMALIALPILGYVLIRMAGMRINKDIQLVRSMDRLR